MTSSDSGDNPNPGEDDSPAPDPPAVRRAAGQPVRFAADRQPVRPASDGAAAALRAAAVGQPQYGQPEYGQPAAAPGQPPYGQQPYGATPGYGYAGQPGQPPVRDDRAGAQPGRAGRIAVCGGITLVLSPFAWRMGARAVREIDANPGMYAGRDQANAAGSWASSGPCCWSSACWRSWPLFALLMVASVSTTPPEAQSSQPTSTGSLTSRMPNRRSTPSRTSRASASRSVVCAPPRLVSASVCLVDRLTTPLP